MKNLFIVIVLTIMYFNASQIMYAGVEGIYFAKYDWGLHYPPPFSIMPVIDSGRNDDEVLIHNLFIENAYYGFNLSINSPIVATLNAERNELTIKSGQKLGEDELGDYVLKLGMYFLSTNEWRDIKDSVTAKIDENGNIIFPSLVMIGLINGEGKEIYVYSNLVLEAYNENALTAKDIEGYYNAAMKLDSNGVLFPVDFKAVPSLVPGEQKYEVNIMNLFPFIEQLPMVIYAAINAQGNIVIKDDQIIGFNDNGETVYVLYFKNSIEDKYLMFIEGIIEEDGSINFPENTEFVVYKGYWDNKQNNYDFSDNHYYCYKDLKLTFLEDFPDAVEPIEKDNLNNSVKFYNMQGIEIENPVKGQLVIKSQGGKSIKMIVH